MSAPTPSLSFRHALRTDFLPSLAVFLVAVPLCVGVAVASGVPAELGLVTGIVGGLVTGLLPGSSLQVSGPAAGLTVLVFEAVQEYGLAALGAIVLASGALQLLLGALRLGRLFRAISVAVVEGMLAGIGLILIAGQLYAMADAEAPATGIEKFTALPGLVADLAGSARALTTFALGAAAIAVMALWPRLPAKVRVLPGALAAVVLTSAAAFVLDLPARTVEVNGLLEVMQPPGAEAFGALAGAAGTVLAFTLIASAESLFSAAAVDRMHDGPRTSYDKELMAQGAGNTVCGLLGALPMTAVIVRSAANVQAGAKTKVSRVLHGVWLLLFAALLPAVLALIPVAALAGVLVYSGFKLLPLGHVRELWREHRGEVVVLVTTAGAIVLVNMFEGVLIGLAMAVVKTAWDISHVHTTVDRSGSGPITVRPTGNATFLRLPKLLDTLESLPAERPIVLDLSGLQHVDHASGVAMAACVERHNAAAADAMEVSGPVGYPYGHELRPARTSP
ncbi:SulP family inorganic anion transporter [Streptomyces sp. A7024]|uniref:SulP family inorganic anion transporter n=1 Tax=Streptomyces coryli TaxID=1128680 RepID=A0A6G4TTD4_9ACTN|nr:SulP family inorganic anion transporter [Streptomyces coryli]NGN62368.1 SulP family inorganic anion transporter [Streptomyces coryli]